LLADQSQRCSGVAGGEDHLGCGLP
jgi:hypothetical protein